MMRRLVVSPERTSSQALRDALSENGLHPVDHLHFLGRRSIEWRQAMAPDYTLVETARRIGADLAAAPEQFRIVGCIRDPVARFVSVLFRFPESSQRFLGVDVYSDPDRMAALVASSFHLARPLSWIEDDLVDPLGLDVFAAPFDVELRSLRVARGGLRLVVVRFEDATEHKEKALGWLVDRPSLPLPIVDRMRAESYAGFLDALRLPEDLLDDIYGSRMMQHFYSAAERMAMRQRWSGHGRHEA